MNARVTAAVFALSLLLSACATSQKISAPAPVESPEVLWKRHSETVAAISAWRIQGRIALKSGREGGSANLLWTREHELDQIEIYGPFGGGRVRIDASPGHALLRDTDGEVIEAASADAALYQRLGWHVPFSELAHWARGLPDGASDIDIDQSGRLRELQNGRWRVQYQDYARVNEISLPRKLTITAAAGETGQAFQLKIILKSWADIRFDP